MKRLLTAATAMLESQSREITALMLANQAKDAELEHLWAQIRSDELLQGMHQPPTSLESGQTLEDLVRHWETR